MRFIEVTRVYRDEKELINVDRILSVAAFKPTDGYGRPQKGSEIWFTNKDYYTVKEEYEYIKGLLV